MISSEWRRKIFEKKKKKKKKNWQSEFGPKSGPKLGFFPFTHFLMFDSLVLLEIAYSDS